jgi:hypothetical protein
MNESGRLTEDYFVIQSINIETTRAQFKPALFKCILIGESPPSDCRFFYIPDSTQYDFILLGIMEGLYPEFITSYRSCKEKPKVKTEYLRRFQKDGFYLLDVYRNAEDIINLRPGDAINRLMKDLQDLKIGQTLIILIKVTIYDLLATSLLDAKFNLINVRIPFPSDHWQTKFKTEFKKALKQIGWNNGREANEKQKAR